MHEVEFLPAWYPRLRKRRRSVVAQAWGTGVVVVAVAAVAGGARLAARAAGRADGRCQSELRDLRQRLGQLDRATAEQDQLRRREAVASDLGVGVDPTRVLAAVEQAMPPGAFLTGLTVDTAEQVRAAAAAGRGKSARPEVDRRLTVKVTGVAPTDLDATTLLARLAADPFLDDVAATYLREAKDGRPGREFELTFGIDLNLNPAALAGAE